MSSPQREPARTGHCASNEPDVQVPSGSGGLKLDTFESIDKRLELLLGRVNKLESSLNQLNVTFDCLVSSELREVDENGEIDEKISEAINDAITEDFQTQSNIPMLDGKSIPDQEAALSTVKAQEINLDDAKDDPLDEGHSCGPNSEKSDN